MGTLNAVHQSESRYRRKAVCVDDTQPVHCGHHDPAKRGERLRVSQHTLPPCRLREQFGQPRDGGHKFHAHADEHQAPKHQQHLHRGRKAGCKRRKSVKQNTEGQHPPPPEQVREIAAKQPENAARKRWDVEEPADPHLEFR